MSYKTLGFHFSPQYYEDPQTFNPDRWKNAQNIPANALMGFNGGPRTCIGKYLARLETKVAVIKFFQRYKKIEPKKNFVLRDKLAYQPEYFKTKLTKA
jgi:cytochrome P450